MKPLALGLLACLVAGAGACTAPSDPMRYRLAGTGSHWTQSENDPVLHDLTGRYPDFFELILDPAKTQEPDLRTLRDDLERIPVDRRNFDALNAVAIAYFEINYRAEAQRGEGFGFLSQSFRSAVLVAVPWRAYGEIEDPGLRDAILDFFEDAGRGEKLGSAATAPRLARVVTSLAKKETDPARSERIRSIAASLRVVEVEGDGEADPGPADR